MNFKRLKIKRILILIAVLFVVIFGITSLVNNIKYRKSYDYKLKEVGYSESEINKIKSTLSNNQIDKILDIDYDKNLVKLINQKYFILSNLEEYLNYYEDNNDLKYEDVISIINTNSDEEWYKNAKETDIEKGSLMLVNRYYGLKEDYVPEDLVLISNRYAYEGNYISESILEALKSMVDAAKEEGYTLIVSQGYRSYEDQKKAYDNYEKTHTTEEADAYAARAGYSEYQTGLSILIRPYNKVADDATTSEEYKWLVDNSYSYGFILRYPENKEIITGFTFEPWRYRYVGAEVANKIHNEEITLDEYYAYYID